MQFLARLCPSLPHLLQCGFLLGVQYVVITQLAFRFLLEEIVSYVAVDLWVHGRR